MEMIHMHTGARISSRSGFFQKTTHFCVFELCPLSNHRRIHLCDHTSISPIARLLRFVALCDTFAQAFPIQPYILGELVEDPENLRNLHDAVGNYWYAFGVETIHPNSRENCETFASCGAREEASLHCRQDLEFVLHSQRQKVGVNKNLKKSKVRY